MIKFRPHITVQKEEWTIEDTADMRELVTYPKFKAMWKTLHRRLNQRTDELIDGEETRPQIQELSDLLLELAHYADPQ